MYLHHSDFPIAPVIAVVFVGIMLIGVIYNAVMARNRDSCGCEVEASGEAIGQAQAGRAVGVTTTFRTCLGLL